MHGAAGSASVGVSLLPSSKTGSAGLDPISAATSGPTGAGQKANERSGRPIAPPRQSAITR